MRNFKHEVKPLLIVRALESLEQQHGLLKLITNIALPNTFKYRHAESVIHKHNPQIRTHRHVEQIP